MNEAMRLLRAVLRPLGYDVRRRPSYSFLPLKGASSLPFLDRVRKNFDNDGSRKFGSNLDTLKIIFRTCLSPERDMKAQNRLTQAPLSEMVECCFHSLIVSVNAALKESPAPKIELLLLDDHSDPARLARLTGLARKFECPWKIQTTAQRGQGASLHEQFSLSRGDDALYYFCEDDYLHDPRAIYEMWAFYRQVAALTRRHLVLHPQEHGCLYDTSYYPSYLVLSPFRHWRTVSDATHQLFLHGHIVRDYWDYFENTKFVGNRKKRRLGSERRTTNRLFRHIPCFAPIPALAGHMQSESLLPPFFDWQALWAAATPPDLS
ncbi:MAG: glycosyltransferase family 2 protein [Alphaproteobacteria bacterium]|nr:glycosyltransferase family 2 protein [Alphaproteobacteria bacterium]